MGSLTKHTRTISRTCDTCGVEVLISTMGYWNPIGRASSLVWVAERAVWSSSSFSGGIVDVRISATVIFVCLIWSTAPRYSGCPKSLRCENTRSRIKTPFQRFCSPYSSRITFGEPGPSSSVTAVLNSVSCSSATWRSVWIVWFTSILLCRIRRKRRDRVTL